MLFSATNVVRSINLLIDYQCPQCGAPATLEETDRLFECGFCRVKSYLVQRGYFRYLLPNKAPAGKELVYFPYWRFKGMTFACIPSGIKNRYVDLSYQAINSQFFPASVGLRSQTLKLKFVTPETEGLFLKPALQLDKVMKIVEDRFKATLPKPILHQSYIGDTLSMLYAPFYVDNKIHDAVLNKPVSPSLPEEFDLDVFGGGRPDWGMDFLPTLCPACGWDLEGERDALVLNCKNCSTAWRPHKKKLEKLSVAYLPGEGENLIYLPFWRIKAETSGLQLDSYADLIRVANLPKVVQEGMHTERFHFWGLAFKVRPQNYLRLASSITLSQPPEELISEFPNERALQVNLPLKEAVETLKLNLASFMKPRQTLNERLPEITITPKSYLLVYLPFNEGYHEYLLPKLNLAINKNQLALAKNL